MKIITQNLKFLSLVILFILLIGFIDNYAYQVSAESTTKNFLWKVTSKTNSVYLFGSFHIASEKMYPLNHKIEKAFELLEKTLNIPCSVNLNNVDVKKVMEVLYGK